MLRERAHQTYGSFTVFAISSRNVSNFSGVIVRVFPNHFLLGAMRAGPSISLFAVFVVLRKYPPITFPLRSYFAFPSRYICIRLMVDRSRIFEFLRTRSGLSELLLLYELRFTMVEGEKMRNVGRGVINTKLVRNQPKMKHYVHWTSNRFHICLVYV